MSRAGSLAARCDKNLVAALTTAVLVAILLGVRVLTGGGPSAPVMAGDMFVGPDHPSDLTHVLHDNTGYDGQFTYRLALDPFTREETAYGITFDNPPYRQQRIGLPLVAHAVTSTTRLPLSVTLLLVNALGLVAAAWAGAVLARRLGRHALWGVLLALAPGLVIAASRDLTEPLATGLLLTGIVAWTGDRRGPWRTAGAVAAFTAAALTRETSLAVLCGLGIYELYRAFRGPHRTAPTARAALMLVPLAVVAAWQVHLRGVWGILPLRATHGDVGTPLVHAFLTMSRYTGDWTDWSTPVELLQHAYLVERLLLAALLVYTGARLARSAARPELKVAWCVATVLATATAWTRDVAFLRNANEATILAVLVLLGLRTRGATIALAGTAGISLYVAVVYGAIL